MCFAIKHKAKAMALPYIDDFGGVAPPDQRIANNHYIVLKTVLLDLGLGISWDKCQAPGTHLTWIGTTLNTIDLTMHIEEQKIVEALELCQETLQSQFLSLHQTEVLLGKMLYVSKLASPARRFLNRLLQGFPESQPRGDPRRRQVRPSLVHTLCEDLQRPRSRSRLQPSLYLYTDTSLVGGGAYIKAYRFMDIVWPPEVATWDVAITELELFMLLVSICYWALFLAGHTVQLLTDNEPSIICLRSGKTKNAFLAACLRELWHLCVTHDIEFLYAHIPGSQNSIADLLSRRAISTKDQPTYEEFCHSTDLQHASVPEELLYTPDSLHYR